MGKYKTVFELVGTEFEKARIPFVLIGGFAVNYYKANRMTNDLDLLMTDKYFSKAVSLLKAGGYQEVAKQNLFARFESNDPAMMDLDIIFVDQASFDGIVKDGQETSIQGISFKVPSLLHLIALKLHSVKHNPAGREYRDLWDVNELIKRNEVDVHSTDFRELCLTYGTEAIYHKIIAANKP